MPASPIPQTWYASLITLPHLVITGSPYYALLGREAEARAGLARLLQEYPDLTVTKVMSALVYSQKALDRMAEGLRMAGMPE